MSQAVQNNLGYSLQPFNKTITGLIVSSIDQLLLMKGTDLKIVIVIGVASDIVSVVHRNFLLDYWF